MKKGRKSKKARRTKKRALVEIAEELPYESGVADKISNESEISD